MTGEPEGSIWSWPDDVLRWQIEHKRPGFLKNWFLNLPPKQTVEYLDVQAELRRLRVRDKAKELHAAEDTPEMLPDIVRLDQLLDEPDENVSYRIEGLLPAGGRAVLNGAYKVGKTTATGNLARCLADGKPFLGKFHTHQVEKVIVLDNEMDRRQIRRWLRDQGVKEPERVEIIPLRGQLSTFNILDQLTRGRWADYLGQADVLIFDCLRPALDALGLDENHDAGRFLTALDELVRLAGIQELIVVHHMGHSGERSRGDSRILDWPDAIWNLTRDEKSGERYFNAVGRDVDVPAGSVEFDAETRHLTFVGYRATRHTEVPSPELIEAVSKEVEEATKNSQAVSSSYLRREVHGARNELIDAATDWLVTNGYVKREVKGQAKLHTSLEPYVAGLEDFILSDDTATPPDPAPDHAGLGSQYPAPDPLQGSGGAGLQAEHPAPDQKEEEQR